MKIRKPCITCGKNLAKYIGLQNGTRTYRPECHSCLNRRIYGSTANSKLRKYKKYRLGKKCSQCGFVPQHIIQIDVDHIDGNHNNNNIENLQILCANCHRLKTYKNMDWI